jgi:hypothetical protein
MTGTLQLTQQANPTAQTFVVDEASVLTGIGIYFASVSTEYPITLELRPTTEGGTPSSKRYVPGTRVIAGPGTDNPFTITPTTDATTFYASPPIHDFKFEEPVYIPANTLVSFAIYTSAPAGEYKMYTAKTLEYKYGKITSYYTSTSATERGAFFASSNGTSWEADNSKDVTFKVYKAQFSTSAIATAIMNADNPPYKKLTETTVVDGLGRYSYDPLQFAAGSASVRVRHPGHGFQQVGDKVSLISDGTNSFGSGDTINGVLGSSVLGDRTLTAVDPFGYSFNMDSSADSSIRAGGTGLMANENYAINRMKLSLPYETPKQTNISAKANLTTAKSFAGSETAYNTSSNIRIPLNKTIKLRDPHVLATSLNETLRLAGAASSKFTVSMWTDNANVAPYINIGAAQLGTEHYLIDYQDSDTYAGVDTRNVISTIDYVSETNADGGTTAGKHITIPYQLENSSTSIVVMMDAIRPIKSDFSVWYRAVNSADEATQLRDQTWTEFSKISKVTQGKTYSEISADDSRTKEYQFAAFDIDAFDQYQIKITMNSQRMAFPPVFRNLRIIATS